MQNKLSKNKTKISIDVEVLIVKEDNYFVAYCPSLELSSYGKSIKEAKVSFEKEVSIFLEETHSRGTLEKYLLKNGWTLTQSPEIKYEPPKTNTDKLFSLIKSSESLVKKRVIIPVN